MWNCETVMLVAQQVLTIFDPFKPNNHGKRHQELHGLRSLLPSGLAVWQWHFYKIKVAPFFWNGTCWHMCHVIAVVTYFVGGAVAYLGSAPFAAAEKNYHRRFATGIRNNMKQLMLYQNSRNSKHNHHIKHIPSWALPLLHWSERNSKPEDSHHHASLRQCTDHPLSPLLSKKLRQHHIIWIWQGRNQHGSSSCDCGKMWSDMLQYLESLADAGLSSDNRQLRQRVNMTCVSHLFGSFDANRCCMTSSCKGFLQWLQSSQSTAWIHFHIFSCALRSSALFAEWKHARDVLSEVHAEIMVA